MISETMPLNEWPIEYLKLIKSDLNFAFDDTDPDQRLIILDAIKKAIKDVEFEQSKS